MKKNTIIWIIIGSVTITGIIVYAIVKSVKPSATIAKTNLPGNIQYPSSSGITKDPSQVQMYI